MYSMIEKLRSMLDRHSNSSSSTFEVRNSLTGKDISHRTFTDDDAVHVLELK